LNGTFVRLQGPRVLDDGDEFMVGEQLLRVELLHLRREYPMHEDTLMYISPPKDYRFRLLHVVRGGRAGASYCSVNNDILIGREGCDVNFLEDRHASRQHARVTWSDGQVTLTDLGSRNGTFFRLREEQRLHHGDYVIFGSELMRVEING
ncbi:MAG: FHA domain-containing protein, partial [Myxococcota bacterium]